MLTFKEVVDALGEEAQVTGGTIIVYRDGKHTEVGKVIPETGVFVMTPAGHAMLEEAKTAEPVAKPKAKPKAKTESSALSDLDLGDED